MMRKQINKIDTSLIWMDMEEEKCGEMDEFAFEL